MDFYDLVKAEFLTRLEAKASWGKNDLKNMLTECEAKISRDLLRKVDGSAAN